MNMELFSVKLRLKAFIKEKGISEAIFEKNSDLSNGFVSKVGFSIRESSLHKIGLAYPDLNLIWLQTGEGNMFFKKDSYMPDDTSPPLQLIPEEIENNKPNFDLMRLVKENKMGVNLAEREVKDIIQNGVPFFEFPDRERLSGLSIRPGLTVCEKIIPVDTSAMEPAINRNNLIGIKEMKHWKTFFPEGSIYVIVTEDIEMVRKVIKNKEKENMLLLIPLNPDFEVIDMHCDNVKELWLVKLHLTNTLTPVF